MTTERLLRLRGAVVSFQRSRGRLPVDLEEILNSAIDLGLAPTDFYSARYDSKFEYALVGFGTEPSESTIPEGAWIVFYEVRPEKGQWAEGPDAPVYVVSWAPRDRTAARLVDGDDLGTRLTNQGASVRMRR